MKLQGQRVVIIGGSSGIGLGIAAAARAAGAALVLAGRSQDRLDAAVRALAERDTAAGIRCVPLDVTDEAQVAALLAEEADHIVVTAAVAHVQAIRQMDLAAARRAIDAKLGAALAVAKHARLAAGGSLTFTAGINALRPIPGVSAVSAGNGGLMALVRALAVELAPIRVNALSPGWVDTPIWAAFGPGEKERRFAAHVERLPARRIGTIDDLGHAAVFLMTNGFTTGTVLDVDGGHRLM